MEQVKRLRQSRNSLNGLQLTSRDYEILSRAGKQRFITPNDVEDLWSNAGSNLHYSRLRRLAHAGLLEAMFGDKDVKLGYRITRKGVQRLPSEELKIKALGIRRIGYRTSYGHDCLLSRVQRIFESCPGVSGYLSEPEVRNLLQSRHGKRERKAGNFKVPDGLFQLRTKKGNYTAAVELEMSVKGMPLYRAIFRTLLLQSDFDIVFYLAGTPEIRSVLVRTLEMVRKGDLVVQTSRRHNRVYFGTLSEFLEKGSAADFQGQATCFSMASLNTQN